MSFFKTLFGGGSSEDPPFDEFVGASMEGLRLQSAAHQETWAFGEEERWDFDQESGELVFTFADRIARAPAQIIGTFDNDAGSWMWSWGNTSIDAHLTQDALRARAYGEERGLEQLTTASWAGEELDGWRMTAVSNRLCEQNGAYRGPAGATSVFFTFGEVQILNEPQDDC